jgi:hypothetical protein
VQEVREEGQNGGRGLRETTDALRYPARQAPVSTPPRELSQFYLPLCTEP